MALGDWLALGGVFLTVLSLGSAGVVYLQSATKQWVRDLFASRADQARIEEKVVSLERDISEVKAGVKDLTSLQHEVLRRLPEKS